MNKKIMQNLENKKYKVIRVSTTEFELDNGDILPDSV